MNSPTSVYPYLLLVVEPKSHFVLGVAMLGTENQTYDALITSIPDALASLWNFMEGRN